MAQEQDKKMEQAGSRKPVSTKPEETAIPPQGGEAFDDRSGRRGGLFQRFGARLQEKLETNRGDLDEEGHIEPLPVSRPMAAPAPASQSRAEEASARRPQREPAPAPKPTRMVIPDGVLINGSVTAGADAEIAGKIEGDVSVDGVLYLSSSALITGNVRAASCRVEGLVAGKVECSQDLEIGETGRLNAEAIAGRRLTVAGEVTGNVQGNGVLRLLPTARISGDIRARSIVIEEGAFFNGKCVMRPSGEKQTQPAKKE